jgi:polyketide cyclase/dehydrase/lipid transport protein
VYTIDLTTNIAAPPEAVWRALTDPNAVVRWDTTVTRALDAPPDYPQPGQHVQWRCLNTTELLHDHPQHVDPTHRLHSLLVFGRQHLNETYTLEAASPKAQAASPEPPSSQTHPDYPAHPRPQPAPPEALEGHEALEGRETPDVSSSLSLEGEGRGEGDSPHAPDQPAESPSTQTHPVNPVHPRPNLSTPETPTAPRPAGRGARGSGGEVQHTTLHLHIDLTVTAPFIAGPLLLHLRDGPATRRTFAASLTNLKRYCEASPD